MSARKGSRLPHKLLQQLQKKHSLEQEKIREMQEMEKKQEIDRQQENKKYDDEDEKKISYLNHIQKYSFLWFYFITKYANALMINYYYDADESCVIEPESCIEMMTPEAVDTVDTITLYIWNLIPSNTKLSGFINYSFVKKAVLNAFFRKR